MSEEKPVYGEKRDYQEDLKICSNASPEPWEHEDWGGIRGADGRLVAKIFPAEHKEQPYFDDACISNGAFIALARTALPWYIRRCMEHEQQLNAKREKLVEANKNLRAQLAEAQEQSRIWVERRKNL